MKAVSYTHLPAEVGQQLGTDNMVLSGPGVFLEPGLHIRRVEVHEALKGPVSYTHLDVYKRQVFGLNIFNRIT